MIFSIFAASISLVGLWFVLSRTHAKYSRAILIVAIVVPPVSWYLSISGLLKGLRMGAISNGLLSSVYVLLCLVCVAGFSGTAVKNHHVLYIGLIWIWFLPAMLLCTLLLTKK
jgi:Na+-driven multidrug efflux pump